MKLKSSKSISYKKTISNPNDFSQNYQQASNNYTNLVKFYNNSIQIHDAIEKIINSYKEGVSTFKKKLIQIKSSLIKPFYNEQTQSYKFDEKIYVNNNSYIYKLNQIINFQIDALTNMINDIEQNLFSNAEKKTIGDYYNVIQQNKNNLQTNYKKMDKLLTEYNSEYKNLYESFEIIEKNVQKYYVDLRQKKLEDPKQMTLNKYLMDVNNCNSIFIPIHDKFQENNKKFFNFYNSKINEFREETNKSENYIKTNFNSFLSLLISNNKSLINSIEDFDKKKNLSIDSETQEKINDKNIETENEPVKDTEEKKEKEKVKEQESDIDKEKDQEKENGKNIVKENENDNEKQKNDLDLFCEQNLVPIKTDYENEKIKIKSIHCNIIGDNLPTQYNEVCNSLFDELGDEELIDNTNNVILQEEDIFNIVKFFYGTFQYIDNSEYDLAIEKKKIEVKSLTNKIIYFGLKKKYPKEYSDLEAIKPGEIKKLEDFLKSRKEYRLMFLLRFNYYRTLGYFDMPEREYEITMKCFLIIMDCILKEKEEDFATFKLVIILSQTFLVNRNNEKYFLIRDIKGHKLFEDIDYIKKYLTFCINEEFDKSMKKSDKELSDKAKQDIVFATSLPFFNYMIEFGVSKKALMEINETIAKDYKLDEEILKNLNMIIETKE